jgi:hypothetical protein
MPRLSPFIVYGLLDPHTNVPFYIGYGKEGRQYFHINEAKSSTSKSRTGNQHKTNKIQKILRSGHEPKIEIYLWTTDHQEAINKEMELIARFGRADKKLGPLTNLTDGGDGRQNFYGATKERHRQRTSEGVKEHWQKQTADEKKQRIQKRINTINSWDPEYKNSLHKRIGQTKSQNLKKESAAEREQRIRRHKEGFDRSPHKKKMVSNLRIFSTLSDEEKVEYRKTMTQSVKNMWANMTPEERELRKRKQQFGRIKKRFNDINIGELHA